MINDDVLVKYCISRIKNGYNLFDNWVDYTRHLISQIRELRDQDFTAIGLGDLSIASEIKIGQRIILSDTLDTLEVNDHASILGLITRINPANPRQIELEIEGIGHRPDFSRDPDRQLKWGQKIYPDLGDYQMILEMISKPRLDGGSVYYFYNKSPRDSRQNWVAGMPFESTRAILGSLQGMSELCLNEERERSQYLHYFRRLQKEISGILKEIEHPVLKDLNDYFENTPRATKNTCKNIAKDILKILKQYE